MKSRPELIVALDVDTLDKAKSFIDILYPAVKIFKVGSQLFTACGPEAVNMVGKKGAKVFLDLKFHDIPNTVYLSAASGTGAACEITPVITETKTESIKDKITAPVFMMTVHITENKKMLEAAVKGAEEKAKELEIRRPYIVGVTILTSEDNQTKTEQIVLNKAKYAKNAGLDGVVCSVHEASLVREELGEDFLIVTAGIRPQGYPSADQARVATPEQAKKAGVDFIVVGRPILEAKQPSRVTEQIIKEL